MAANTEKFTRLFSIKEVVPSDQKKWSIICAKCGHIWAGFFAGNGSIGWCRLILTIMGRPGLSLVTFEQPSLPKTVQIWPDSPQSMHIIGFTILASCSMVGSSDGLTSEF